MNGQHIRIIIVILSILLVPHTFACAETSQEHSVSESIPKEPVAKSQGYAGIYYGNIINLDDKSLSITVKGIEPSKGRELFYLDKKTRVQVGKKKSKFESLYFGDKVAVRFFGEGRVSLADAIFVVFGPFQPKDYQPSKLPGKVISEGGKEGGEEHGEGKKEKEGEKAEPEGEKEKKAKGGHE